MAIFHTDTNVIVPSIFSINIFYSSLVTWRHVEINPYPHNGGIALHLFGSQQSQLETVLTAQQIESSRWQRALQVQRTRTAAAFTSRNYPLNPLCARRVTEPCLTSVSRSPRQGERTFDIFCLATTFCRQKDIFWPHIRKCTMGLDGFQVPSISAWSHSAEVLELCLVWLKAAPHLRLCRGWRLYTILRLRNSNFHQGTPRQGQEGHPFAN